MNQSQGLGTAPIKAQQQNQVGQGFNPWQGMKSQNFFGQTQQPVNPQQQAMDALNASHPYINGLKWRDMSKQLGYGLQPQILSALDFYGQMQPQQFNAIRQAMSALNPANRQGRVEGFRKDAMGQANDQVNSQMGMLGNLDQATADALRIGAMNSAQQSGNEFMQQQYNPEQDVRNAMASSQLMAPGTMNPYLDYYMNLTGQGAAANPAKKGPDILGTVLGAAGTAAQMGWSPFKTS